MSAPVWRTVSVCRYRDARREMAPFFFFLALAPLSVGETMDAGADEPTPTAPASTSVSLDRE